MKRLHKIICIALGLAVCAAGEVRAQQVTPRIAGLEQNEEYMTLLQTEARLQIKEDSISKAVADLRRLFRDDPESRREYGSQIMESEERIFGIRSERGRLIDRITAIEQEWVVAHLDSPEANAASGNELPQGSAPGDQKRILIANSYFARELPAADYAAVQEAQRLETQVIDYVNRFYVNYQELSRLAEQYAEVTAEAEAGELYERYAVVERMNGTLADSLAETWSFIYDNKTYAYAYLLDKLGQYDILSHEQELHSKAAREYSELQGQTASDILVDYFLRKQVVVDYETKLAGLLNLDAALDSLRGVTAQLRVVDYRLPRIELQKRYFLDYAPIEYSTTPKYSYQNPIPECKIHSEGTIYRLLLGTFNTKRAAAVFRGAYPLSYVIDENGKWRYFAGGFATRAEADEAQKIAKEHGFVRPEVVVWRDGVYRNLSQNPETVRTTYRIEMAGTLSDQVREVIAAKADGRELSRVGADRFVVGIFEEQHTAAQVADAIRAADPALEVKLTELVEVLE